MATAVRTLSDVLAMHDLLPLAWRAGEAAGRFLRDERPDVLAVDTKSTPTDAVTAMDRAAEALITAALLGARPTDGLLGEEGGERLGTSGVRWIVDPLDGTVNYLYGLPQWGVSIAAEVDGVVVVGVVVAPALGEGYVAVRGGGSWQVRAGEARAMVVPPCSDLSMALTATGFGYRAATRQRQAEVVVGLIPQVRDVRRLGAAVIDFSWLALGRLDAYYEAGLNHWDYAAGALIAQEAGAFVSGLDDDDLSRFFVACAPGIAEPLLRALRELRADDVT